jgi:outer membrane assembly lipoprotein YfiO
MHKKNIKKGFFVNNKKYILSFIILGILNTLCHATSATTSTSQANIQESTSTTKTTPQKKEKTGLINKILQAPRCPYSTTPLKKLTAPQLEEVHEYTKTHKMDAAFIIELLERLIALSDNHAGVKRYKLQLADTHYDVHHLEKAASCYEDFAVMYPGSSEHEYVLYKAMVCMFELSLDCDRDQTNTKKTIVLIKEFLKHAQKPLLITEAKEVLQKCYDRLFDHEVYVFNFYLKKKSFVPAQMRLDYIIKNFPTMIANLNEKVAVLAENLELAKNPVKPTKQHLRKKFIA